MKKRIVLFALLAGLLALPACGGTGARETVTIALWSDQLTEGYAAYLRDAFPEVDFVFYTANNSTDFYRFKYESGDLPDILTVRRFSLRDVADWKDALLDLSDTPLAASFHSSYLRSYTYGDGTVNWLPVCGEVDGILLNKALLEKYGIPVPTDYNTFREACHALTEQGVRPFSSNFGADYTCMEVLQGLSAARLSSQEGRAWRQQYESGQTDRLDEDVWLPVFERMEEFIGLAGIDAASLEGDTAALFQAYQAGEAAMIRGTCAEAAVYGAEEGTVMLPYFGETEEENWFLTYPAFQVAASARAGEDPARKSLILDILSVMLGPEGQRHIATGRDMIAYNKEAEMDLSPMMAYMPPCLEGNRLYIRLASAGMFSISRQVVQGMITGEYPNARAAFDAFNAAMAAGGTPEPEAARLDKAYSYAFRPEGGSPAASAVMNTLREEVGARFLIGQSVNIAGNIRDGAYTAAELRFLTMGEGTDILLCDLTGEQLYQCVSRLLAASGGRGAVINDSSLYVSSGFEMAVRKDGGTYQLERLTCLGEELDRDAAYLVALLGNEVAMLGDILAAAGVTEYEKAGASFQELIAERLASGGKLAEPTDYITLY